MASNYLLGKTIVLPTKFGDFQARHIESDSKTGVCLFSKLDSEEKNKKFLLRVQSSCLFSESFWTTDCDCSLQLEAAMKRIHDEGGLLIYFYEEGRGAGLKLKMEAIYMEQTFKYNTKQAFECLDIKPDERNDYKIVGDIVLEILGKDSEVYLLTNNSNKERLVRESGVNVVGVEKLVCLTDNPKLLSYLNDKQSLLGHDIFS